MLQKTVLGSDPKVLSLVASFKTACCVLETQTECFSVFSSTRIKQPDETKMALFGRNFFQKSLLALLGGSILQLEAMHNSLAFPDAFTEENRLQAAHQELSLPHGAQYGFLKVCDPFEKTVFGFSSVIVFLS